MQLFAREVADRFGFEAEEFATAYSVLHKWTVDHPAEFWRSLADFVGINWQDLPGPDVLIPPPCGKMRGAQWFPGATLNFAQNLIPASSDSEAIVSYHESVSDGLVRRALSASRLRLLVAGCQVALKAAGVGKGDRVCGALSNTPEAIVAMLATASLGAVWSSCSPDFGQQAIVDRFGQISPKFIFATTAYVYGGKYFDCVEKIRHCAKTIGKNDADGTEPGVVWVDHLRRSGNSTIALQEREFLWSEWVNEEELLQQSAALVFEPCGFGDPLYIVFSSGTTGVPKCIVHTVGGTLLQHKKEILLHCDLGRPGVACLDPVGQTNDSSIPVSRLMFFTTCGWMMWNWMVSALACGVGVVVYDGSPVAPDAHVLWDICRDEQVTTLGLSPKLVAACQSSKVEPASRGALASLRWILSTGAPLLPEQFDWLECVGGPGSGKMHVASISGGTDILSCFMLGHPLSAPIRGEIQGPGLGMDVDCWDEDGNPVRGCRGELVCKSPFVSMPAGFWNDPDGTKYQKAYFSHFASRKSGVAEEVWRHGDFIEFTGSGGIIVHGRSDATLNPGGVRIGTAELYRVVECIPGVADSVAVGIDRGQGEEIVLLVKLAREDSTATESGGLSGIGAEIRRRIRAELSPRHLPAVVFAVDDIPYTRSGKKMELVVAQILRGEPVVNINSVANPESIEAVAALRDQLMNSGSSGSDSGKSDRGKSE